MSKVGRKTEMKTKTAEVAEKFEYEKFCDVFAYNFKKGMFALCFGQASEDPPALLAKIWMDAIAVKRLQSDLQEAITRYEKKMGKIGT